MMSMFPGAGRISDDELDKSEKELGRMKAIIQLSLIHILEKGLRTGDMMSEGCTPVGCRAMGDAICAEI